MGSIASRPKVPSAAQPQVIYVPQTVYTPAPSTATPTTNTGGGTGDTGGGGTAEPTASDVRTSNLLSRNRGIFGTVTTSFRGLLSLAAQTPQRKTLLGE